MKHVGLLDEDPPLYKICSSFLQMQKHSEMNYLCSHAYDVWRIKMYAILQTKLEFHWKDGCFFVIGMSKCTYLADCDDALMLPLILSASAEFYQWLLNMTKDATDSLDMFKHTINGFVLLFWFRFTNGLTW